MMGQLTFNSTRITRSLATAAPLKNPDEGYEPTPRVGSQPESITSRAFDQSCEYGRGNKSVL